MEDQGNVAAYPAESGKPLERAYNWSCQSVIGMLNYLCGTRPDLLYSVHQCSQFCNNPSNVLRLKHYPSA